MVTSWGLILLVGMAQGGQAGLTRVWQVPVSIVLGILLGAETGYG